MPSNDQNVCDIFSARMSFTIVRSSTIQNDTKEREKIGWKENAQKKKLKIYLNISNTNSRDISHQFCAMNI